MTAAYALTPELRKKLSDPFGTLIRGTYNQTMGKIKEILEKEKPPMLISVGDVVSLNLHAYNLQPQLSIIDNKSLRTQILPKQIDVEKTVHVDNPQGTITEDAISAIKTAIEKNEHTHIVVDGEEDLLTLIAILYAQENAVVVYGQPHEGIVAVKVTYEKKAQVKKFLKAMKPSKS